MTFKKALDDLRVAFGNFELAARSDDKTPLQNALALSEAKDSFATSDDSPSILIFADINNFKAFNTRHGYTGGDAAIGEVGRLIQVTIVERGWGQAFRLSGDEFVVLLRSEFLDDFHELSKTFSNCEVILKNQPSIVSLSFGYAQSAPGTEFDVLRDRAEMACKTAKTTGEGICVGWTQELERSQFKSFRHTCGDCGSLISCETPTDQKVEKLSLCPACGNQL